ncbi:Superoxide dismutase [Talaromyces atroroseus]|uniref:Superoxide dismutase n=1 Tax=Talaromyces atroroseus TaxID=1441469 RepID=A0A225AFK0_TALAT|nr:Superoxide dismutase [Talaromyces atroroseus]OKL60112.1 Superoxide dismutase [Talaromyces atroroseus]
MSASLLRTSTARAALRAGASAPRSNVAGLAGTSFVRTKVTLPDLAYDYGALEPSISGKIMEIHHKGHHNVYVTGYNTNIEKLEEAQAKSDIAAQIALKPLINFHGGGHINHTLFWENLAPKSAGGGEPPSGSLGKAIDETYGTFGEFQNKFNTALAGIQGSGWAWLVKDKETGDISIKTYANQDPVVGQYVPILGVDAWEHAYYLQYQNRKAEYFKAIWEVLNWKAAEKRFGA